MAYLKPSAFTAKVSNRIVMRIGVGGVETLTVTGRVSGKPQHIPVIPVEVDGALFLVCPRGETQWVRNARATPRVSLSGKSGTHAYDAVEVSAGDRRSVITAYRAKAGKSVGAFWSQLPDDADHPVFRLTPA